MIAKAIILFIYSLYFVTFKDYNLKFEIYCNLLFSVSNFQDFFFLFVVNRLSAALSTSSAKWKGDVPVLVDRKTALMSADEMEHYKHLKEGNITTKEPVCYLLFLCVLMQFSILLFSVLTFLLFLYPISSINAFVWQHFSYLNNFYLPQFSPILKLHPSCKIQFQSNHKSSSF